MGLAIGEISFYMVGIPKVKAIAVVANSLTIWDWGERVRKRQFYEVPVVTATSPLQRNLPNRPMSEC